MVTKATVIGPIVPLAVHVGGLTSYKVVCAVQLEGGEVRTCVFPHLSAFPSIRSAVDSGCPIAVCRVTGASYVEAIPTSVAAESA